MKWLTGLICVFLVSSMILEVKSDNILVLAFVSSKSHKLTYMNLVEELGKRGHNVTVVTPIKAGKPMKNVKEYMTLDMEEVEKALEKKFGDEFDPYKGKEKGSMRNPFLMLDWFKDFCRDTYDLPIIKQLQKEKFDMVLIQPTFNDCAFGLVHKLKAPLVLFVPLSAPGFILEKVGGHLPPSFNSNIFLGYSNEMSFYQRFVNFGFNIILEAILRFYFEPAMASIYREKLGEDVPLPHEILGEASLVLSNGHFSLNGPKPHLPDTVDVGGIHSWVETKPLPKDLEEFIKKGKDGFIFFSMGSHIKGSTMPEEKRKMFLKVFSKLKQRVLWKWETETMPGLPENVKLSKWLPQQDLLGHKDVKIFITHCGGGSTEEAIFNGVPLVGFPMFGDQPGNAKLAKSHGMIVELDWNTVTEQELTDAINDILNNPMYRENAKKISALLQDQPDKPMDRAIFWLEYVLRHKGAPHLRAASRKLNWFQYHSYDVILTYIGLISLIFYISLSLLKWICRKVFCRSPKKTSKSKKE